MLHEETFVKPYDLDRSLIMKLDQTGSSLMELPVDKNASIKSRAVRNT